MVEIRGRVQMGKGGNRQYLFFREVQRLKKRYKQGDNVMVQFGIWRGC